MMSKTDDEAGTIAGELLSALTEQQSTHEAPPLQSIPVIEELYTNEVGKVDDGTAIAEGAVLVTSDTNNIISTFVGNMESGDDSDDPNKKNATTTKAYSLRNNSRFRTIALIVAIIGLFFGISAIVGVVVLNNQKNNSTSSSSKNSFNSKNITGSSNQVETAPDVEPLLSDSPSASPTVRKTYSPTVSSLPSSTPTISVHPSSVPTAAPTITASPTGRPSITPTTQPTITTQPTTTTSPTYEAEVTTFYAIGDVPYASKELVILREQMKNITDDAEFVIHIGDMRFAKSGLKCIESEYTSVSEALRLSRAPVFIIIGDNDWVDCANPDEGLRLWNQEFLNFHDRYWNHTFDIKTQPGRPMNFHFIHKGTLFFGLNIIGGRVKNATEWKERLSSEAHWTIGNIRRFVATYRNDTITNSTDNSTSTNKTTTTNELPKTTPRIVIFGHANPFAGHKPFFDPLLNFIENDLKNSIPLMYLNGDKHVWEHHPNFMNQSSFLRIIVNAKAEDPPLQVRVHANGFYEGPFQAFPYDRMLPPGSKAYNLTYDEQNALGEKDNTNSNRE